MADDKRDTTSFTPDHPGAYLVLGAIAAAAFTLGLFASGAALVLCLGGGAAAGYMAYALFKEEKRQTDPVFAIERNRYKEPVGDRLPEPHVDLTPHLAAEREFTSDQNAARLAASQGSARGVWWR